MRNDAQAVAQLWRRVRARWTLLLLLPAVILMASCHKAGTTTPIVMQISPTTAELNVNVSVEIFVGVRGGTNNTVSFTVNGTAVASGGSLSDPVLGKLQQVGTPVQDTAGNLVTSVLYTAPASATTGTKITIVAISTDNISVTQTATITLDALAVVGIAPPGPVTLAAGATQQFSATVLPAPNQDVIWQVNGLPGGSAGAGLISSGGLYTAPPSPPPGGSVTVSAVSIADPGQSASATVNLTFGTTSFQGSYAFALKGTNASGVFSRSGSFTTDSAGHLTSGLEDVTTAAGTSNISFAGTYTLGADGRGTLTFGDGLSPSQFRIVLASHNRVQIISFDTAGAATGAATGEADLQNTTAFRNSALLGTYIFDFAGTDSSGKAISEIGEFVGDGAGGIHNGEEDINDNGSISHVTFTGTYSVSANGRATATFVTTAGTFNYAFYVVSAGTSNFVATDASPKPIVSGSSIQQAPTATFSQSSLNGNYAFLIKGANASGSIATVASFSAAGTGLLTGGLLDENNAGTATLGPTFTGSYAVDAAGRGTATLNATNRTYTTVFYLDGNGNAFLQEADSFAASDGPLTQQHAIGGVTAVFVGSTEGAGFTVGDQLSVIGGGGSGAVLQVTSVSSGAITGLAVVSAGAGYSTTTNAALGVLTGSGSGGPTANITGAALNGNYALQLSGGTGGASQQFLGQLALNSSGTLTAGNLDMSTFPSGSPGQTEPLLGTLSIPSSVRGTLSLNPLTDHRTFLVYAAGSGQFFVLQIDSGSFASGTILKQF